MDRLSSLESMVNPSSATASKQPLRDKHSEYQKNMLWDYLIDVITQKKNKNPGIQDPLASTGKGLALFAI